VLVQMLLHMTERVQMLHEQGIVHRDLKPGNILWRPSVHSWTLIDFGCAAEIGAHPLHARPSPLCAVDSSALWGARKGFGF
jgi:serine/threonine protein kinase